MQCRYRVIATAVATGLLGSITGAETLVSSPFKGVTHYQITDTVPRPLVISMLEIDLTDPDLSFFTNPSNGAAAGETDKIKTTTFVQTYGLEGAVNGGFWNTAPAYGDLNSIAVSNGAVVSPWAGNGDTSQVALNITQDNVAAIVRPISYSTADIALRESTSTTPVPAWTTVGGNRRLINGGVVTTTNDTNGNVARTGAGVNQAKTKLYLVTVDGRDTGSAEGMTIIELGNLLKSYGAYNAINLDGGGSTTMAFSDRTSAARLVNSPSDGTERSVANSLGFHAVRYPQWNVNASGNWTDAANWVNGIPNAVDSAAHFKSIIASNRVITLNGDKTVGRVTFEDGNRYTLTGSTLKMDVAKGSAKIDVLQATHYIDSIIQPEDNLEIQVASSGLLRTAGLNNAAGKTISKVGLGTWTLNSGTQTHGVGAVLNVLSGIVNMNTNAGSATAANLAINVASTLNFATKQNLAALTVTAGGVATIAAGGANVLVANAVATTSTGKIDLTNNAMVLKGSSLAAVDALITAGYHNGDWLGAGIASSTAATNASGLTGIGYFSNADVGATSFEGVSDLDADDVLVKYTYYGDADLNGVVDPDDFNQFLAGFQDTTLPRTWLYGDFDYNNVIDPDDFNLFLAAFQNNGAPLSELVKSIETSSLSAADQQLLLGAVAAVPEPTVLGLFGVAAGGLLVRRRSGLASTRS